MTRPTRHRPSRPVVLESGRGRRFGVLRAVLWGLMAEAEREQRVTAAIEQAERAGV